MAVGDPVQRELARTKRRQWLRWAGWAFLAYLVFGSIFVFVPAGHVGVYYDRGRGVLPTVAGEGLALKLPYWQKIYLLDARIQEYTMSVVPDEGALYRDDSLDAPTSDGQQVRVDATVIYRINADKAAEIVQLIGEDYAGKLIRPFSRSQIRMIISRYTAPAIYSEKRQEAEAAMTTELAALLAPKDIVVDKVLLRAVYFSDEYSQAIEQKVVAEQRVKQAEFEAQEATKRAEAKVNEAKGLAEAQNLQKASLTKEYLQFEAVQRWDGKLPQVTGGSVPFINLPSGTVTSGEGE